MPFTLRPFRRFPMYCAVTYNAGPFQGQGTLWNLWHIGLATPGDLQMRPGETPARSMLYEFPVEPTLLIGWASFGRER
jgi:hypothetical protein